MIIIIQQSIYENEMNISLFFFLFPPLTNHTIRSSSFRYFNN